MSLKLSKQQAAAVKAAVASVRAAADAASAATDTGTLKAALNRLWFAAQEAHEIADRAEKDANLARLAKLEQAA